MACPGGALARLLAISDLHVNHRGNLDALAALPPHPDDHLLVPGDVGDRLSDLDAAWRILTDRFASVTWTPGNHELWDRDRTGLVGPDRYAALAERCAAWGVRTPEDPPWVYQGEGGPAVVCPLFVLYDYSLAPAGMGRAEVVRWAAEAGIRPTDERLLGTAPYADLAEWNRDLVEQAEGRLAAAGSLGLPVVALSHFPWRRDLNRIDQVRDGLLRRFLPWCGATATEDWHRRFGVSVVVHGHLHMRATDWRDGVRFEEVALGYPRHWRQERGVEGYLRPILPGPLAASVEARWHR